MALTPDLATLEALAGVSKWAVGITIFVTLMILMGGLLIFGGGREHS